MSILQRFRSVIPAALVAFACATVHGQIRITEFMHSGSNGEFVELTNLGGTAVDMTGWSFDDSSRVAGSFSLSAFGSVAAGESIIFTEAVEATFRTAWGLAPGGKIIGGSNQGLSGTADEINIYDASNSLVDRLTYTAGLIPASRSGWVCTAAIGANDISKWIVSAVADQQGSVTSSGGQIGSPGVFVSIACPNAPTVLSTLPAKKSSVASLPSVSVTFSAAVTGVVAGNLTVNGSAATSVSGSGTGPYVFSGYAAPASGSVTIALASGAIVSQFGLVPFAGDSWTVAVGISIVINELHYHPHDTIDPGQTTEFAEIYNAGASAINLSGWSFSGFTYVIPAATMINPGGYVVVAANPAALQTATGYAGALQRTSGALSNSGENISILDAALNVIDSVTYSDSGAWPTSPDGGGPSLELINPNLPNQYASAWRPSTGHYGTPGAVNSTFVGAPAPLIDSPMHTPSIPTAGTTVQITATVIDDSIVPPNVTLNYRQDAVSPPAYSSTPMFDDGAHGDGAAGDNVYGATLPGLADGEQYQFYLTADDGSSVATYPVNHPTANPSCVAGCLIDENPACIVCQSLLCKFSNEVLPTDFPVYHIVVSRPNKAAQESLSCNGSPTAFEPCKTEYDATFVDHTGKVYYNVTERFRGQSSIVLQPKSYAVDFPSNNQLPGANGFPVKKLILNGNQPTRQKIGFDIVGDAGLPTSRCSFVRLRYTGINYDVSSIGTDTGYNGLHACIERVDNDMLDSQAGGVVPPRDTSSNGNLYRGENTASFDWRGTDPNAYRVNFWGRNGYAKENNEEADSWSDLITILDAMNNSPPANYAANVAAVLNEDLCLRYFALHNILANKEGGIYRDTGDDYYFYTQPPGHPNGLDARFITWDTDSVLRDSNTETIWRTGNVNNVIATIRNFIRHNAFAPIFVKDISDLINTGFMSPANFNARIDAMPDQAFFTTGGSTSVPRTRQQFKDWYAARVTFMNNEIIDSLTLAGVPASPYTNANPVIAISGQINQAGTHNVTVNGQPATFSVYLGTWSHNVTLYPGINKITVKSFDRLGAEMQSITNTVTYDPPQTQPGLRLTMPTRMLDTKTLSLRADLLDASGNIEWHTCSQLGTVSATRLSDGSPVPTSITVFESFNEGAGAGAPPADSIRFYNGVGSVSITLDQGAATPPGDILVTVTLGAFSASKIVEVVDADTATYRVLSGTLSGAGLTWSPTDGIIHLTADVTVNGGNTLTIQPGTLIMVDAGPAQNGTAVNAQGGGKVSALASRINPIFFFPTAGTPAMELPQTTPNNNSSWRGIYHQDSATSNYSFVIISGAGNAVVTSHPRPPILRCIGAHNLVMQDCVLADCPGMGTSALTGASGAYTFRRCLFSRVGIGGEWLGTGVVLTIEDTWFTRIGRAPEANNVDGDVLHLDRPGNTYVVRRSVLTDCGDDMIDHSTGAQPIIENCLIYDARDKVVSIGPLVDGPTATITMSNCLIYDSPGGIRCNGAPAFLANCTLGNSTNVNGQACTSNIQRCIIWPSSANTCCGTVDYTIIGNEAHLGCGTGNLSTSPFFVSTNCNYTLLPGSPALTAGPGGTQIGWLGFPFPTGGCVNNVDCNDGNPCTTDTCDNGSCTYTPVPGCCLNSAECDDGSACTTDACTNNVCTHTPISCDDGNACTTDTCDPQTGCVHTPTNCDDGNPCTIDSCDPQLGCLHTPVSCPQGQACNPLNGQCELAPVTLMFQNGLNGYTGTHDTFLQQTLPNAVNGALETIRWDTEESGAGTPIYTVIRFDDLFGPNPNQIPAGSTITSATLTYTVGGDANATGGAGDLRELLVSWDESTATFNNFGGTAGVQSSEYGASSVGTAPGTPLGAKNVTVTSSIASWLANPTNNRGWIVLPTTTDGVQNRSSEYVATPADRPKLTVTYIAPGCASAADCNDNDACTTDTCVNNQCQHAAVNCDDGNPCTMDSCNAGSGCTHTPIPGCCQVVGDCDDSNPCTTDTCVNNQCQNTPIVCDDSNPCTADSCVNGNCVFTPIPGCCVAAGDCNDNNACTTDACVNMQCENTPVNCDDGIACTVDSCDTVLGCQHVNTCNPVVVAVGPRYIRITPPAGIPSVALRVESAGFSCLPKYVDATGHLSATPVFQSSAAWGSINVGDRELIPNTLYNVAADVRAPNEPENLSPASSLMTWAWGDVDHDGDVSVFDIVCVLDGFQSVFTTCTLQGDDLQGTVPDRLVDVFDIMAVLDAFQGMPYPDPAPCNPPIETGLRASPGELPVVTLVPRRLRVNPGAPVIVDVFISRIADLRAYQLGIQISGTATGMTLEGMTIDSARPDYAFMQQPSHSAMNTANRRMANVLQAGSVDCTARKYLATLQLRTTTTGAGRYTISLVGGGQTVIADQSGHARNAEFGTSTIFVGTRAPGTDPENPTTPGGLSPDGN